MSAIIRQRKGPQAMWIEDAIAEAVQFFDDPPPNEASTCDWVILPLLRSTGYAPRDILSRSADHAGKFPDYTVLPQDEEHSFFLEAKAWNIDLEDSHAVQALNYANQNGKKWVVLTNGREWRLYNNDIRGLPEEKLVAEAVLGAEGGGLARFLAAIGRESVSNGMLAPFAEKEASRRKRAREEEQQQEAQIVRRNAVNRLRQTQISDPNSPLIACLLEYMRTAAECPCLTAADIVACFGAETEPPSQGVSEKVLVLPARNAYEEYMSVSAYICQANRRFEPTTHVAFYSDRKIQPHVPRILGSVESVSWREADILSDPNLSLETRNRLISLLREAKKRGVARQDGKSYKVMFLAPPGSPDAIRLPHPIENDKKTSNGKPWPFTVGHRYIVASKLLSGVEKTSQLEETDAS